MKLVYNTELRHTPFYTFKLYTDKTEYKKISGHRFVKLVSQDMYNNDIELIMDFFGLMPFVENDYMKCGKFLEEPLIKWFGNQYDLEDVRGGFGFGDLEHGNDDFHFIRDMMFTKDGTEYLGEIKTFYNKKKIGLDTNPFPEPHITWWLQTRLMAELLDFPAHIFYYHVDGVTKNAVLKGRNYTIKPKYAFMSDVIRPSTTPEKEIEGLGLRCSTFQELMDYALERREELLTRYRDENGEFYYAEVPVTYNWWNHNNHVEKFIELLQENQIQVEKEKF